MVREPRNEETIVIVSLCFLVVLLCAVLLGIILANNEEPLFTTEHDSLTAEMYDTYLLIRENGHPIIKWWIASPGGAANYLAESAEESFTLTHTTISWLETRSDGILLVTVTFDLETEEVTRVSLEQQ